jgi:CheY-like chemotaxis protein
MKPTPEDILCSTILIVDDQEANVRLLERLLREAGYSNVSSTTDSLSVCALHLANKFDLILLDLEMPNLNGFEVMERLKHDATESYLPVIVLTAQPGHKLRALQAGAKDFVSKPFDLVEVKTRIHNMLEVRLLYRSLARFNEILEQTVRERTEELRESEERFRRLTQLASDWYWEQNESGDFTRTSGPVLETLDIGMDVFLAQGGVVDPPGWNVDEHRRLHDMIADRQPFLDFPFSRVDGAGKTQHYRVSGEPIFDSTGRFKGYRGIGAEVGSGAQLHEKES